MAVMMPAPALSLVSRVRCSTTGRCSWTVLAVLPLLTHTAPVSSVKGGDSTPVCFAYKEFALLHLLALGPTTPSSRHDSSRVRMCFSVPPLHDPVQPDAPSWPSTAGFLGSRVCSHPKRCHLKNQKRFP